MIYAKLSATNPQITLVMGYSHALLKNDQPYVIWKWLIIHGPSMVQIGANSSYLSRTNHRSDTLYPLLMKFSAGYAWTPRLLPLTTEPLASWMSSQLQAFLNSSMSRSQSCIWRINLKDHILHDINLVPISFQPLSVMANITISCNKRTLGSTKPLD